MLKEGTKIKFSARVLSFDTDGNIYLFLGDDDWSVMPYQWGFASNQIWFDTMEEAMDAARLCDQVSYRNYKIVPGTAELIRYTAETVIEPITKFELTAPK